MYSYRGCTQSQVHISLIDIRTTATAREQRLKQSSHDRSLCRGAPTQIKYAVIRKRKCNGFSAAANVNVRETDVAHIGKYCSATS